MTHYTEEERLLAHRYLYYVLSTPVISDREYDIREKAFLESAPGGSLMREPGSDRSDDYPSRVRDLAISMLDQ